ncbi:MAG: tetratricopeptide repeat protein [Candidatus Sumerlaeia bacterium]
MTVQVQRLLRSGAALIVLLGMAAFFPVFFNDWVYDDRALILENPRLASWRYLPTALTRDYGREFGSESPRGFYRPLLITLVIALRSTVGTAPLPYRVVSLFTHIAGALALMTLVRRLGRLSGMDKKTGGIAALLAGVVYVAHPLHVETVCLFTDLPDKLTTLFVLLALIGALDVWVQAGGDSPVRAAAPASAVTGEQHDEPDARSTGPCCISSAETPEGGKRAAPSPARDWTRAAVLSAGAAFLAAASKESGLFYIAGGAMMLVLLAWRTGPPRRLKAVAVTAAMWGAALGLFEALRGMFAEGSFGAETLLRPFHGPNARLSLWAIETAVRLILIPQYPQFIYDFPDWLRRIPYGAGTAGMASLVLASAAVVGWLIWRRRLAEALLGGLIVLNLYVVAVATSSLVFAERYVAVWPAAALAGLLLARLVPGVSAFPRLRTHAGPMRWGPALVWVFVALSVAQSIRGAARYATMLTFWKASVVHAPGMAASHLGYATALKDAGDFEGAVREFQAGLAIEKNDRPRAAAALLLAELLIRLERPAEAAPVLEEARRLNPDHARVPALEVLLRLQQGDIPAAQRALDELESRYIDRIGVRRELPRLRQMIEEHKAGR